MFLLRLLILLMGLSFQAYSMEEKQFCKFTAFGKSLRGERKVKNEDYYVIENRYLAIFDGHGGYRAAEYAHSFLYQYIKQYLNFSDENIIAAYQELDTKISCLKKQKHEHESGTTALSVFLDDEDNLVVANVGDSRGILISNDTYFDLTDVHRPINNNECIRINNHIKNQHVVQRKEPVSLSRSLESSPAVIKRLNFNDEFTAGNKPTQCLATQSLGAEAKPSNPDLEKWTPERVKDKWVFRTGLNITRSLGHPRLKKYGLSECPSIKRFSLDNNFNIVVLFSDGLGDYISNQEVVSLIRNQIEQGYRLEDMLESLMKLVEDKNENHKFNDDASLIIAFVDKCHSI